MSERSTGRAPHWAWLVLLESHVKLQSMSLSPLQVGNTLLPPIKQETGKQLSSILSRPGWWKTALLNNSGWFILRDNVSLLVKICSSKGCLSTCMESLQLAVALALGWTPSSGDVSDVPPWETALGQTQDYLERFSLSLPAWGTFSRLRAA